MNKPSPNDRKQLTECVDFIFSTSATTKKPDKNFSKNITNLFKLIIHKGTTEFLTDECLDRYNKICCIVRKETDILSHFTTNEVINKIKSIHEIYIAAGKKPTTFEFCGRIHSSLLADIKEYKFIIPVDGIVLDDIEQLHLGPISIQENSKGLLNEIRSESTDRLNKISAELNSKYVMIGSFQGSPRSAKEQFKFATQIATGILAIYATTLSKNAFTNSRISARLTAFDKRNSTTMLSWCVDNGKLTTTIDFGDIRNFTLAKDTLDYFNSNMFFKQMASATSIQKKSEIQDIITTAVYWYHDAYKDTNLTMKFIKLWSCCECFFSKNRDELSEKNAKGIAAVLTFGGFEFCDADKYLNTKQEMKHLYNLRSNALHEGNFRDINKTEVKRLAEVAAWLIITMVALNEQGYTKITQIEKQSQRLDQTASG